MDKDKLLFQLCELSSKIGAYYHHEYAHDCFCKLYNKKWFQYEEKILEFIKEAVKEKMEREPNPKSRWED